MATAGSSAEATLRPRRRPILWLLVLSLAVLVAVTLALRSRGHSGSQAIIERLRSAGYPTTLVELDRWYTAVPDADNAALIITAAAGNLPSGSNSPLPFIGKGKPTARGQEWEPDVLRAGLEYVAANRAALDQLVGAASLRGSRYPVLLTNGFNCMLPHLSVVKGAAQALAVRSGVELEEGKVDAAARSAVAVFAMGRSLENEPVLISHLVRLVVDSIGVTATERLLNRAALPEASLAELQAVVASAATNRGLERAHVGEACMGLGLFQMSLPQFSRQFASLGNLGPASEPGLGTEALVTVYTVTGLKSEDERFFVELMERMILAAKTEWWESAKALDDFEQETIAAKMHWYRGRLLSSMLLPAMLKNQTKDARSRAALRCAVTAVAIERFRLTHGGRIPESLSELVPAFLASVPADPFIPEPLHFRRQERGYVVYSFGPDRNDDQGREFKSGTNMGDDYDVSFTVER